LLAHYDHRKLHPTFMGTFLDAINDFQKVIPMLDRVIAKAATGDPGFVHNLRNGRDVRASTRDKVLAWLAQHREQHGTGQGAVLPRKSRMSRRRAGVKPTPAPAPALLRSVYFEIPTATSTLNEWQHLQFSDKKKLQTAISWLIQPSAFNQIPPKPFVRCKVTTERYKYGIPLDWDSLVCGCKPLLIMLTTPAICKAKLSKIPRVQSMMGVAFIHDDNLKRIVELQVHAQPSTSRRDQTLVTIDEIS
jgi:hypothetical protein